MNSVRTQMPHVVLWLPVLTKVCRELLHGILRFARLHGSWSLYLIDERRRRQRPLDLEAWGCTGMIVDMRNRQQAERLLTARVPAILWHVPDELLDPAQPYSRMSRFRFENATIGAKAAEYLLERGFLRFAFVGTVYEAPWSTERRDAFHSRLTRDGLPCEIYPSLPKPEREEFSKEQRNLCDWLKTLPKPVALFAANDERARQVLDSCLTAGIAVPREVAVLGVDNDELICETAQPQLSSIQMTTERAGLEAASLLDRMMRGSQHGSQCPTVIPVGFSHVVTRRSTETVQTADPLVARADEFIRINAGTAVKVDDLVRHLHVSRRWLEKRFKAVMGRTVYAEIMHIRLERVQTLLRESAEPIDEIASACGFASASHLGTLFRQHFDTTPAAYRRRLRAETPERPSSLHM
jgi:LacI family transcriptional regulator